MVDALNADDAEIQTGTYFGDSVYHWRRHNGKPNNVAKVVQNANILFVKTGERQWFTIVGINKRRAKVTDKRECSDQVKSMSKFKVM